MITYNAPSVGIVLPISKKKLKIRAINLAEKKALLTAITLSDEHVSSTLMDVLRDITNYKGDIVKLPKTDVDYILVKMKINSSGSMMPIVYTCGECEKQSDAKLNLDDAKVDRRLKDLDNKFKLNDGKIVELKPVSYEEYVNIQTIEDDYDKFLARIIHSISVIYDDESVYDDLSDDELAEFVFSLPDTEINRWFDYIGNVPEIELKHNIKCPHCGHKEELHVRGTKSFFL